MISPWSSGGVGLILGHQTLKRESQSERHTDILQFPDMTNITHAAVTPHPLHSLARNYYVNLRVPIFMPHTEYRQKYNHADHKVSQCQVHDLVHKLLWHCDHADHKTNTLQMLHPCRSEWTLRSYMPWWICITVMLLLFLRTLLDRLLDITRDNASLKACQIEAVCAPASSRPPAQPSWQLSEFPPSPT